MNCLPGPEKVVTVGSNYWTSEGSTVYDKNDNVYLTGFVGI